MRLRKLSLMFPGLLDLTQLFIKVVTLRNPFRFNNWVSNSNAVSETL